jgi:hypothetical protein
MAKTFQWRQYFLKRIRIFHSHWFHQISFLVIIIAGLVTIYTIFKPEASTMLNVSFWGSFFVIWFGVFLFLFIFSLTSWGRKVINKMPWEMEYGKRDARINKLIEDRVNKMEKKIIEKLESKLSDIVEAKPKGKGLSQNVSGLLTSLEMRKQNTQKGRLPNQNQGTNR